MSSSRMTRWDLFQVLFMWMAAGFTLIAFNTRVKTALSFAMLIVCYVNSQSLVVHQDNFNCQSVVFVFM